MIVFLSAVLVTFMVILCRRQRPSLPVKVALMFCVAAAYTMVVIRLYDPSKGGT